MLKILPTILSDCFLPINMKTQIPDLKSLLEITDDDFYELCQKNPDVKIERSATGGLIVMSPTGGETGYRNSRLNQKLANWSDTNNLGIAFDSSTGFKLPNNANLSPDASWVRREKIDALTPEEKRKFLPLSPDFVVELRSETDALKTLQSKMEEYMENGVRLGWLIDAKLRRVEVYRQGQEVEILANPKTVSGEDVLPGFVLEMESIFRGL
jgi:Uma2 family endonuclease